MKRLVAVLWVTIATAGCKGGMEGGGACGDTDCGGNVVGGWTIDGNCLDSHPLKREDSLCPQGAFNILSVDASGKVVFRTDDTYSAKITTTNRVSIGFPPACRETGTGQQWTCAELNEAFALSPLDGTQSSSCAGGSDDCACTFVTTPTIISEDGTYTTTGGKMRMSHDDVTDVQEVCVDGDRLRLTLREDVQALTLNFAKEVTP